MLAHISGLQREAGEMFVTGDSPTEENLVGVGFDSSPREPSHYSNLAFGLLGRVVATKSGMPYTQYVDERSFGRWGSRAQHGSRSRRGAGYLVD